MKIIFCDTNKLFGAFRYFTIHKRLYTSSFLDCISAWNEIYISDFVIDELDILAKREGLDISPGVQSYKDFCEYTGIKILSSNPFDDTMLAYVHDKYDAQILQDAIDIHADILLTHNIKDFKRDLIRERFWLVVMNRLPDTLFVQ